MVGRKTLARVVEAERKGFPRRKTVPGQVLIDEKSMTQIINSKAICDIAVEATQAKANHVRYLEVLSDTSERLARENNARKKAPADSGGYQSTSNTVISAFERMGILDAIVGDWITITCQRKSDVKVFNVRLRGTALRVLVREPVMVPLDPVSEAELAIRACGIENGRDGVIIIKRSFETLGVREADLVQRGVDFIAQEAETARFAYLARRSRTEFQIPSGISGEDALWAIDEKIVQFHQNWYSRGVAVPIPLSFIEAQAERIPIDYYEEGKEPGGREISRVLEYLARDAMHIPLELIPLEYRDALQTLRSLKGEHMITRGGSQMSYVWDSLDLLDNPALKKVRDIHSSMISKHGDLESEEMEMLLSQLVELLHAPLDICGEALANLAKAYGVLSVDHSLDAADIQRLTSEHARMMLVIRKGLKNLVASGYIVGG